MKSGTFPLVKGSLLAAWDTLAWVLATWLVLVVSPAHEPFRDALLYILVALVAQLVVGVVMRIYLGGSRVGSYEDATSTSLSAFITGAAAFVVTMLPNQLSPVVGFGAPPVALLIMLLGRWAFRATFRHRRSANGDPGQRVIVYGAGRLGSHVARLNDQGEPRPFSILGFVDDDRRNRFLRVRSYPVLGTGRDLPRLITEKNAEAVILAISAIDRDFVRQLADSCRALGVRLIVVPPVTEMVGMKMTLGQLRDADITDLLGRGQVETDTAAIATYINGATVLITGAGGSIGSELARQVHRLGPRKLVLLDRDETLLHSVQLSIYGKGLLDTDDMVLCDIRDIDALDKVFEHHKPDVVFHAAALKHLPMLEQYPDEAWKTNVLGSRNVMDCAARHGVKHVVNVSTDKAADPTSVLGKSKRLAERVTAGYADDERKYVSVRFGNVLGSRGSVLYSIRAQIERGGPVTVTHPEMTRYFMTIPEACELVIQAGAIGQPGQVMILDMGEPVSIQMIAERLIADSGLPVDIVYTGLRPGEKIHEDLFGATEAEQAKPSRHPLISAAAVPPLSSDALESDPAFHADLRTNQPTI